MRSKFSIIISTGLLYFALCTAGHALDVDFEGTIASVCSLSLSTDGTLALSGDGTIFGSEESGGIAGAVLILSIGTHTLSVNAPIRVGADPAGYVSVGEVLEVKYSGASGLGAISQDYTATDTDFAISNIPLSLLTLHNRIVNSSGFAAGNYTTRTVVTCS